QGQRALRAIDGAREKVAGLIHATPEEVVFTSGATECNNLAIKGVARAMKNRGKHLIVSEVEHFSVLNALIPLINEGYEVTYLKVDRFGLINAEELKREIRDETILISVMHANSEIGTIMPVEEIGAIARERNAYFHCDATATVGHIPVNVEKIGADLLTVSAHNFYGPKGVGALFIRGGTQIEPLFDGGFQEHGQRAGTENVPGIVGLGKAAEIALVEMEEDARCVRSLENQLRDGLMNRIDHIHFTGHPTNRLPGHVSFWVEFAEGESLLIYLNIHGVMAASGSACSSNLKALDEEDLVASHVLKAIGVPSDICTGSITFSMGKWNTSAEVDYVLEIMPGIVQKLWEMSPSYSDYLKSQAARR
ncbi:MAG: cysteine desulfurase, partial [Deltaproteobacteria bacterium]|nr:cysteine desulfurase [Deltaproteobacteria bacterium]